MVHCIQTGVVIVTVGLLTCIYLSRSTVKEVPSFDFDLLAYPKGLIELRQEFDDLKQRVFHIEENFTSSHRSNRLFSWIRTVVIEFVSLSTSFLIYSLFLYLFHLCVFNSSTSQTMKILHIVNIISYSLISIVYESFQQISYSNLAWFLLVLLFVRLCCHRISTMSCPMFLYGFTIGSIVPLAIVYLMRPESLTNLWEFFSSSLFLPLHWSDGVAQRFNLTFDLFLAQSSELSRKMYTCFNIEHAYQLCSWIIYLTLFLSIILLLVNQHWKNSSSFFTSSTRSNFDLVFFYFCLFLVALLMIFFRLFVEEYFLGRFQWWTIVYLLWYMVSFVVVYLWNR